MLLLCDEDEFIMLKLFVMEIVVDIDFGFLFISDDEEGDIIV